jgi:peptidoglycan glycosyltransferase
LLDYTNIGKRIISAKTANELKSMMRYNVTEVYKEKNYQGLELCAKTGTAEVGSDKKPHAWFVGFMDRDDFPLAFVVVVENGGRGIQAAAPIAKTVLEYAVSN